MIIFWLVVIAGIIWLLRWLFSRPAVSEKTPEALAILKARYAKGEISKAEFEDMKKIIN